jgi:hypothetical protein
MICPEFVSHPFHPFRAGLGTLPIDLHLFVAASCDVAPLPEENCGRQFEPVLGVRNHRCQPDTSRLMIVGIISHDFHQGQLADE